MEESKMVEDRILAIDIGGGTQDILIYDPKEKIENCYKLVLPTPTVLIGGKVAKARDEGKAIWLTGYLMGGGRVVREIKNHLKAGLDVYSTSEAALTINDNLIEVQEMGVRISETKPSQECEEIYLSDFSRQELDQVFLAFDIKWPEKLAMAVQDHGFSPEASNRLFRINHWKRFINNGGQLEKLVYMDPPEYMTRMVAMKKQWPNSVIMDTGSAAMWGALCDPIVKEWGEKGMVVLNIGNQHTVAFLVRKNRVYGVFEDHTKLLDQGSIKDSVDKLRAGTLEHQEVFNRGGHGAYIHEDYKGFPGDTPIVVTGPNRQLVNDMGYYFAVPCGDMMLSGAFGLVAGYQTVNSEKREIGIKL